MSYRDLWMRRLKQLVIVNVVFGALGIYLGIQESSRVIGLLIWILGSWIVCSIVNCFTSLESRMGALASSIGSTIVSSLAMPSSSFAPLFAIVFVFNLFKCIILVFVLTVILLFNLFIYPFSTIYYFLRFLGER